MADVNFKQLFADKAAYPDNLEITLGNGATLTLGALRAHNDLTNGELTKTLSAKETKLNEEATRVQQAAEVVAQMYVELTKGAPKAGDAAAAAAAAGSRSGGADELAALENDTYLKPVVSTIRSLTKRLESTTRTADDPEVKSLKESLVRTQNLITNRELRRTFDTLDKAVLPDEFKQPEKLTAYAIQNNYRTNDGLPDIEKAHRELSEPTRLKKAVDDKGTSEYARGLEAGRAQAAAAMMPQRSGFGTAGPDYTDGGKTRQIPKNLNEAISMAAQDPEIQRLAVGAPLG